MTVTAAVTLRLELGDDREAEGREAQAAVGLRDDHAPAVLDELPDLREVLLGDLPVVEHLAEGLTGPAMKAFSFRRARRLSASIFFPVRRAREEPASHHTVLALWLRSVSPIFGRLATMPMMGRG